MQTKEPSHLDAHPIKVLLIDDQRMVGEAVRRMLLDIPGLQYRFCSDPQKALDEANEFQPTVILQDLVMPGVDGIELVNDFRHNPATAATPLIVLSSKEEASTKADAFNAGANDYLVKLPDKLELMVRVRYHSDAYILRLQRDEAFARLEAQQLLINQELAEASNYVRSLLPAPLATLNGVSADWRFIPSSSLGGDSFGYHWIAPTKLAIYLLDVCGHGVGAALLSVSAINTIRNRALPLTDFAVPSQVLAALNRAFPMDDHNGKYFTIFYGVYDTQSREITYASGGHPAPIAITPDGTSLSLAASGMIIGALPMATYADRKTNLPEGTRLFVFSDGCYEVFNPQGEQMSSEHFAEVLGASLHQPYPLDHALAAARDWQTHPEFDDDFSLVEFHF